MRPPTDVDTLLARFLPPSGAPRKARVATFACVPPTHFGTPLTRCVASQGAPPETPGPRGIQEGPKTA
eukprot:8023593-Pyramimonas_sp.AAC.1